MQYTNFILEQSKDTKRCARLFKKPQLSKLIKLLDNEDLNESIKKYLIDVIYNYLEQAYCEPLDEEQLALLTRKINSINVDEKMKTGLLLILIANTEKTKNLPSSIISNLLESLAASSDEAFCGCVLLTLSNILKDDNYLRDIKSLELISTKLMSTTMIVQDENKVNDQNSDNAAVSCLAANILLLSVKKQVCINENIIKNLLMALDSSDKQTRIYSAQCIYIASKYVSFESNILVSLKDYINDEIIDVSTYSHAAYCTGLLMHSEKM
jgi:hypothetical protein